MDTSISFALVSIGLLIFLAHLLAFLFSRKMVPDVLMLILLGVVLGPVFGVIKPSHFGSFGSVFTTITLVVILFEGGTTLSFATLKSAWRSTMTLALTCFFVVAVGVSFIAYFLFDCSMLGSIILGAIMGNTSSAVVIPLVNKLSLGEETKTVLILESAVTDVLCIVIALAGVQAFVEGKIDLGTTIGSIIASFVLATAVGAIGAMFWSRVLSQVRNVQNSIFTTPAFVFVIYGTSELLGYNGAIASLAFGITMANVDKFTGFFAKKILGGKGHLLNDTELVVLKELTFLLKTFFFVYIGVSVIYEDITAILYGLILTVAVYIIRLIIARTAHPLTANLYDKSIISLMTPKGLAAAVLATIPVHAGMPDGPIIRNIVYSVILFSIITTSVLIMLNNKSSLVRGFYAKFFGDSAQCEERSVKEIPVSRSSRKKE